MGMLLTALAVAAITAVFVWLHLRRQSAAPATEPEPCPRCGEPLPVGAALCPGCGAPPQAYAVVRAPLAPPETASEGIAKHALVRADVCVGCGTCVAACPEPGALKLVDHRAIVDLDLCKGHASCVAACPVNAIVVSTGRAVQTVEVPELDTHFQSNVPGLYVVGELGGRGLIKNAINEGKLAIEHVERSLRHGARRVAGANGGNCANGANGANGTAGRDHMHDVAIVGSGPAGLSAAIAARRSGLDAILIEQGTLAETISKYPRKKLLLAEPMKVPLYGDLWVADASKEELLAIWEQAIERSGIQVLTHRRVEEIEPAGGVFFLRAGRETFAARRVVLAMGRRGTPRRLGVPGEALGKVFYDIVEMEAFAGQRALVVGGGDSAVESALGLANQPHTPVVLSYRGEAFGRVKERNRAKLDAAIAAGQVTVMLGSQVREIREDVVVLEHEGRSHVLPNDVVIVRIGGEAPYPFLERIGIRIVRKEIALEPAVPV